MVERVEGFGSNAAGHGKALAEGIVATEPAIVQSAINSSIKQGLPANSMIIKLHPLCENEHTTVVQMLASDFPAGSPAFGQHDRLSKGGTKLQGLLTIRDIHRILKKGRINDADFDECCIFSYF